MAQNATSIGAAIKRAREQNKKPGANQGVKAGQAMIGGREMPGLGRQLTNKVNNGSLTAQQAQRTMGQRKMLENVYGDDWRTKVFGKGGAKALNPLTAKVEREKYLKRAKAKVQGNGGTTAS